MNKISLPVEIKNNRIWLPKVIQDSIGNKFIRIYIQELSFITRITQDGRFAIPKFSRNKLNLSERAKYYIKVEVLDILEKPNEFIKENRLDLLYFIQEKTLSGFEILILKEHDNKLRLWYSTKGRPNEIVINRFVPFEFVRLLGYYQAEGGKLKLVKRRGRELNFTNTSLELIKDFINLSRNFLDLIKWKISIRYHEDFDKIELINLNKILSDLGISSQNINTHVTKRIAKYSVKLWITNSLIAELIFNCMNNVRKYLVNSDSNELNLALTAYFLQGVIAGDGNIYCVKGKKYSVHPRLSIFEGNEKYIEDYSKLLRKFNIFGNYVKRKDKNLFIYSGYINKNNLQGVIDNKLINYSKGNFERLLKVKS